MKRLLTVVIAVLYLFASSMLPALATEIKISCSDDHRDLFLTTPFLTGNDVLELQERLIELGFDPGTPDGIFGDKTKSAVIELQLHKDMEPTGVATLKLWDKLTQDISSAKSASGELTKPKGKISIVIDTDARRLTVFDDDKVHVEFPVAVGKYNTPTPVGEWMIVSKYPRRAGGALGTRWMGLNVPWGTYGIHGTNKPYSIGSFASLGCIRMNNRDVEKLYPIIPHGTPVKIISESYPKYPPRFNKRSLKKGMTGPDVVEMQTKLKEIGVLWGRADGRYGASTEMFVKRYQALTNQEITGEFDKEDYEKLEELMLKLSATDDSNLE